MTDLFYKNQQYITFIKFLQDETEKCKKCGNATMNIMSSFARNIKMQHN